MEPQVGDGLVRLGLSCKDEAAGSGGADVGHGGSSVTSGGGRAAEDAGGGTDESGSGGEGGLVSWWEHP